MPRMQPDPGYCTAAQASARLGVSQAMLSQFVSDGKLKRYGPRERKHKFYKLSEIEALVAAREFFPEKPEHHLSIFSTARPDDMPIIVDMDVRTFGKEMEVEWYLRWLRKNPETFFAVRAQDTTRIVGYACMVPMRKEIIDQFVRGELPLSNISEQDIELYLPGSRLHIYIICVVIDPDLRSPQKQEYAARLLTGLFAFLMELADRGVEILTITARSEKGDGIRLLRKMGIPELHSPTREKRLFSVVVADSGAPLLESYSARLALWKARHPTATQPTVAPPASVVTRPIESTIPRERSRAGPTKPTSGTLPPPDLPEGSVSLQTLADELEINRTTLLGHIVSPENKKQTGLVTNDKNGLSHMAVVNENKTEERKRYFTPEQADRVRAWHRANTKKSAQQRSLFDPQGD